MIVGTCVTPSRLLRPRRGWDCLFSSPGRLSPVRWFGLFCSCALCAFRRFAISCRSGVGFWLSAIALKVTRRNLSSNVFSACVLLRTRPRNSRGYATILRRIVPTTIPARLSWSSRVAFPASPMTLSKKGHGRSRRDGGGGLQGRTPRAGSLASPFLEEGAEESVGRCY